MLDIDLGQGSVSHIITSPPYGIETISYLRTHLLSYRSLIAHLHHDPYDTQAKTIGSEYLVGIENDAGTRAKGRSQTCRLFFEKNQQSDNPKVPSTPGCHDAILRRYAHSRRENGHTG